MKLKNLVLTGAVVCSFFTTVNSSRAQGTAFTYQGRLNNASGPASGSYDLSFALFATNAGGVAIVGPVTNTAVAVSNGLFTTIIDFGSGVFTGGSNWLEIGVRTNGSGIFSTLAPRQQITTVPYAIFAGNVSGVTIQNNNDGAPNVIAGSPTNFAQGGVVGATISGGGAVNYNGAALTNSVTGNFGTVSGGAANTAGNSATVGGGYLDTASGLYATVSGGYDNTASGQYSTAGGGYGNTASGSNSVVSGGSANSASGPNTTVSGGSGNYAYYPFATVGGGGGNSVVFGSYGTVGGGNANSTSANYATVAGGNDNGAAGNYATVGGGGTNGAFGDYATVAGGNFNGASGAYGAVGGGYGNSAGNATGGSYGTVGGGYANFAYTNYSTVGGGSNNLALGINSSVSGGGGNTAGGQYAIAAGGHSNNATGDFSFAGGNHAQAPYQGDFVWADDNGGVFQATGINQFYVRAGGGVAFYTSSSANTGATLAAGSSSWSMVSDRNAKENFQSVDAQRILSDVAAMPMTTWNYKTQDKSIRHVGPMAQDFHAAFQVGENDTTISTVDEGGVALAAIQGLNQKVEEQRSQLEQKQTEIADLKERLEKLERTVNRESGGGK